MENFFLGYKKIVNKKNFLTPLPVVNNLLNLVDREGQCGLKDLKIIFFLTNTSILKSTEKRKFLK